MVGHENDSLIENIELAVDSISGELLASGTSGGVGNDPGAPDG